MTRKNPLRRSGAHLQQQGALWFRQTRTAGETFVADSRNAGVTFAQDMTAAGDKLLRSTSRSSEILWKALRKEALDWRMLLLKTRDAYAAALEERLDRAERQALSTREALKPHTLEATVLTSARDWLDRAQTGIDRQLEKTGQAKAQKKPSASKVASKASKPKAKKGQAPLRNYDQLTARDVANRVQRLSGPQATAVLEYERARKKRATVIRAAEHRLSAAS